MKLVTVPTRKFITIATTLAWIILTAFMLVVSIWFPAADGDLLRYVWGSFSGLAGLVIGFYFGKSTALEVPNNGEQSRN